MTRSIYLLAPALFLFISCETAVFDNPADPGSNMGSVFWGSLLLSSGSSCSFRLGVPLSVCKTNCNVQEAARDCRVSEVGRDVAEFNFRNCKNLTVSGKGVSDATDTSTGEGQIAITVNVTGGNSFSESATLAYDTSTQYSKNFSFNDELTSGQVKVYLYVSNFCSTSEELTISGE